MPQIPFAGIEALARNRTQKTSELFTPNDFYGHAAAIKEYCGLPGDYGLKAVMEHGPTLGGKVWNDLADYPLPGLIAFSPVRENVLRRRTNKALEFIGPFIFYSRAALTEEEHAREKARLGRNIVFFPVHSNTHITIDYDYEKACDCLASLGKEFDTVRVCLYWRDIQLGLHKTFQRRGFECVTAGHIFDPEFLPRLKSILTTADLTVSNGLSTAIGYSVFMDIPHLHFKSMLGLSADTEEIFRREYTPWHDKDLPDDCQEVEAAFAKRVERVTPEQREVIDRLWGTPCLRSPEELREILTRFEEMFQRRKSQRNE
jgi:hypothetical protein